MRFGYLSSRIELIRDVASIESNFASSHSLKAKLEAIRTGASSWANATREVFSVMHGVRRAHERMKRGLRAIRKGDFKVTHDEKARRVLSYKCQIEKSHVVHVQM